MAKTKFAEVIYETGSHSIVSYQDESELKGALAEQHRRAKDGDVGGPTGHPAERVKTVLLYDEHPADHNSGGLVSVDALAELSAGLDTGGQVSVNELNAVLNAESSPVDVGAVRESRHASMYKAPETGKLDLKFLDGGK